jgi:L-lactate dehydrogenase complex protein LldG
MRMNVENDGIRASSLQNDEMKDDRAQVLAQVRESLRYARLPSARPTLPPLDPAAGMEATRLVEQFASELASLGVKVYRPTTAPEAIDTVIESVRAKGLEYSSNAFTERVAGEPGSPATRATSEILGWDDSELPPAGLGAALRVAGIVRLDPGVPADPTLRRARLAELGRAAVGLTGALAGLADTGTLALLSGPTRPRLASLLPPVHLALVAKSAIYPTMAAFFAAHPTAVREASNLVFVTGPSRTADIEQTLTLGVHGPREVHVVLVE